eukprot:353200-Chlamydomonas_euryale.AAC.9
MMCRSAREEVEASSEQSKDDALQRRKGGGVGIASMNARAGRGSGPPRGEGSASVWGQSCRVPSGAAGMGASVMYENAHVQHMELHVLWFVRLRTPQMLAIQAYYSVFGPSAHEHGSCSITLLFNDTACAFHGTKSIHD